jgi:thymidylate kinase
MSFQHILLEGIDLSGKSSAIQFLNSHFPSFSVNHQKLCRINYLQTKIKELQKEGLLTPNTIGHLYAESIRFDIENFASVDFGDGVLQDSLNLLRSLAYHSSFGNLSVVKHLESLAEIHPKMTKAFVFTASLEVRQARLMKRFSESPASVTANDLLIINNPSVFQQMDSAIIQYAIRYFNAEVVDTTNLDLVQVQQLLLQKLR